MIRILAALFAAVLLAGCGSIGPEAYRAEKPVLDFFRYFEGTVDGWGLFVDRSNKVAKRFVVVMRGTVAGNTLTLDEDFSYSDGTKSKRIWTVTRLDANRFSATAPDVIGKAQGEAHGNALRWNYVLALDVDGTTYHVDFDDWMYLQDEAVLLNRAAMSKFGVRLGELIVSFRKRA